MTFLAVLGLLMAGAAFGALFVALAAAGAANRAHREGYVEGVADALNPHPPLRRL